MKTSNKLMKWIKVFYQYSSEDIRSANYKELMELKEIIKEIRKLEGETKQKMSEKHKGKPLSKEHCLNLSLAHKGEKMAVEII